MKQAPFIDAKALKHAADTGTAIVLDVRTDAEYTAEHIPGSFHVPLDALPEYRSAVAQAPGSLVFVCRSGKRATEACELVGKTFAQKSILAGGMQSWTAAGYPVIRSNLWSLERQVRVVAGAVVLAFALLALLVHPAWAYGTGIVGAGLLFAGLTDTCGMALLLARMPWNRQRQTNVQQEVARLTRR